MPDNRCTDQAQERLAVFRILGAKSFDSGFLEPRNENRKGKALLLSPHLGYACQHQQNRFVICNRAHFGADGFKFVWS